AQAVPPRVTVPEARPPAFEPAAFTPSATNSAIAAPAPVSPVAPPGEPPLVETRLARPLSRTAASRLMTRADLLPSTEWASRSIEEELNSIKRLVAQLLQEQRVATARSGAGTGTLGLTDPLASALVRLTERQVSPALANQIVGELRDSLDAAELA